MFPKFFKTPELYFGTPKGLISFSLELEPQLSETTQAKEVKTSLKSQAFPSFLMGPFLPKNPFKPPTNSLFEMKKS